MRSEELIVRNADIKSGDSGLLLDLGVWQPQAEALFDKKKVN